jgi:hypothetical protein
MSSSSTDGDPVLDLILGRDGVRLSFAGALGIAFVVFLLLAATAASGFISGDVAFGAFVVVVVAVSWNAAPATAAVVSLVGFAFAVGFAVDADATLSWHGESDLVRLTCLAAMAVTASLLGYHNSHRTRSLSAQTQHGRKGDPA